MKDFGWFPSPFVGLPKPLARKESNFSSAETVQMAGVLCTATLCLLTGLQARILGRNSSYTLCFVFSFFPWLVGP